MGLHTLHPQPDHTGLGSKVVKLVHGLGAIKAAWDLGSFALDAGRFAAPYVAAAGRAALPLIAAV